MFIFIHFYVHIYSFLIFINNNKVAVNAQSFPETISIDVYDAIVARDSNKLSM